MDNAKVFTAAIIAKLILLIDSPGQCNSLLYWFLTALQLGYLLQPQAFCQMALRKSYLLVRGPEERKESSQESFFSGYMSWGTTGNVLVWLLWGLFK